MQPVNVKGFFYDERHARTIHAAETVLSIVSNHFGAPKSVLDVGCGVGTWLFAAQKMGAVTVSGVEGAWLNEVQTLAVPRDCIEIRNLEEEWTAKPGFDLAISLEVAEHIVPAAGDRLVAQLCKASPLVLFSAAVPGQGGNGHVNEQWPAYWQKRFAQNKYRALDCVRSRIWDDEKIPWWYRQNILVFAEEKIARDYYVTKASEGVEDDAPVLGATVRLPPPPLLTRVVRKVKRLIRS